MGVIVLLSLLVYLSFWWFLTYQRLVLLRKQIKQARRRMANQQEKAYRFLADFMSGVAKLDPQLAMELQPAEEFKAALALQSEKASVPRLSDFFDQILSGHQNAMTTLAADLYHETRNDLDQLDSAVAQTVKAHNKLVLAYNSGIEDFPTSMVAEFCDFKAETLYGV